MTDVIVSFEGSLVLFQLITNTAKEFVEEHVSEDAMFFGSRLVVETRYAENLIEGMREQGLEIE